MDRLIYTSMTGANAALQRQSLLAANLANASTPGFRAELSASRAVPVERPGPALRVFASEGNAGYLQSPGSAQRTGRNLDLMAIGQAWFTVQGLDGLEAYTRAGSLSISEAGALVNGQGLQMLDEGGAPIIPPFGAEISISSEGQVVASLPGQPPEQVGRLKLVTPTPETPLQRGVDGLFRSAAGEPLQQDPQARLESGAVENSNVNSIEAMVSMIDAARQFDVQMRLLQSAESNDKAAAQLLGQA